MRRVWRDIPEPEVIDPFITVFSGGRLKDIRQLMVVYHDYDKTSVAKLKSRYQMLEGIAADCEAYIAGKNADVKLERKVIGYQYDATAGANHFRGAEIREQRHRYGKPVLNRLNSIVQRARMKAGYLRQLENLLGNGSAQTTDIVGWLREHSSFDASGDDLPLRMTADPKPNINFLHGWTEGLADRLEAVDPAHRSFGTPMDSVAKAGYGNGADEDLLNGALVQYARGVLKGDIRDLHFFMWLEEQPITTSRESWIKDYTSLKAARGLEIGHSVEYLTADQRQQCLLQFTLDGIKSIGDRRFVDANGVFSTVGMMHMFHPDYGAFAYLGGGSVLCHEHTTFRFHHSSFMAGAAVKCAGMIKVVNGKIEAIMNHSGHYRPGDNALRRMVLELRDRHRACFAPNAVVQFAVSHEEEPVSTLKPRDPD